MWHFVNVGEEEEQQAGPGIPVALRQREEVFQARPADSYQSLLHLQQTVVVKELKKKKKKKIETEKICH